MATSTGHRVFAFGLAILFLVTSVGFSGMVIWQMKQDSKTRNAASSEQTQDSNEPTNVNKENALEGKPLNGFTPIAKIDTLEKIDQVVGTGDEVKAGDTVTAHYTGAVAATGIVFQSSYDTGQPVPFSLSGVIQGWTEGVPGMKVGGKRRLLIPAAQAYGETPPQGSNIPANADLVFDIELVKIGE